jgi:hypothetical protein
VAAVYPHTTSGTRPRPDYTVHEYFRVVFIARVDVDSALRRLALQGIERKRNELRDKRAGGVNL